MNINNILCCLLVAFVLKKFLLFFANAIGLFLEGDKYSESTTGYPKKED